MSSQRIPLLNEAIDAHGGLAPLAPIPGCRVDHHHRRQAVGNQGRQLIRTPRRATSEFRPPVDTGDAVRRSRLEP